MPTLIGFTDDQVFNIANEFAKETNRVYIAEKLEIVIADAQSKTLDYLAEFDITNQLSEVLAFLESTRMKHHECGDPYYSCPKTEDGEDCRGKGDCDCGADDYNKRLDEMICKLKK